MINSAAIIAESRQSTTQLVEQPVRRGDAELEQQVRVAVGRAASWLRNRQQSDGYWCGELEGDTIPVSEYVLLLAWLGRADSPRAHQAAAYLVDQQRPHGGWAQYPAGDVDISASVKAYFALKLTGHDPDAEYMRRAHQAIRARGGVDAVNSFTRFYLALLGQIDYDHCPAVPPEAVLLPAWFPISIYRISAWSRTILVPLSMIWALRPTCQIPKQRGVTELFIRPPSEWPPLRSPGLEGRSGWFSWERFFRFTDNVLKQFDRLRLTPLRQHALRVAERWMLERFEDSDGLGAIFPSIVWSTIALKCLGYDDESPELQNCRQQLERLIIQQGGKLRLQPCLSPVWDTALSVRGLAAAGAQRSDRSVARAVSWLLRKEVKRRGDWAVNVKADPGGWFFEHNNAFYPDVDDTSMVMMALHESGRTRPVAAGESRDIAADGKQAWEDAHERGRRWVLAMQNHDGGWGAFDRNNSYEFLCHVPFADHNAMIDPSTPDVTGRVLECLAQQRRPDDRDAVDRAVRYLRRTQEPDGSWPGRWGVNYIYGTWQALVGLSAITSARQDPIIDRGAQWLLACQQPCGGWGESPDSYLDASKKGLGPVTASQTAWALLGLMAAGLKEDSAVERGVRFLLETQPTDGSWTEHEFTGTGFPRVFYLRYHMYPAYFPLLALAQWSRLARRGGFQPPRS